jgi:hypothetical protein
MRSSLTHPITERRRQERRASWHHDGEADNAARAAEAAARRGVGSADPADLASYSCECGLVFSAAVSTTVQCPHCGAQQAW